MDITPDISHLNLPEYRVEFIHPDTDEFANSWEENDIEELTARLIGEYGLTDYIACPTPATKLMLQSVAKDSGKSVPSDAEIYDLTAQHGGHSSVGLGLFDERDFRDLHRSFSNKSAEVAQHFDEIYGQLGMIKACRMLGLDDRLWWRRLHESHDALQKRMVAVCRSGLAKKRETSIEDLAQAIQSPTDKRTPQLVEQALHEIFGLGLVPLLHERIGAPGSNQWHAAQAVFRHLTAKIASDGRGHIQLAAMAHAFNKRLTLHWLNRLAYNIAHHYRARVVTWCHATMPLVDSLQKIGPFTRRELRDLIVQSFSFSTPDGPLSELAEHIRDISRYNCWVMPRSGPGSSWQWVDPADVKERLWMRPVHDPRPVEMTPFIENFPTLKTLRVQPLQEQARKHLLKRTEVYAQDSTQPPPAQERWAQDMAALNLMNRKIPAWDSAQIIGRLGDLMDVTTREQAKAGFQYSILCSHDAVKQTLEHLKDADVIMHRVFKRLTLPAGGQVEVPGVETVFRLGTNQSVQLLSFSADTLRGTITTDPGIGAQEAKSAWIDLHDARQSSGGKLPHSPMGLDPLYLEDGFPEHIDAPLYDVNQLSRADQIIDLVAEHARTACAHPDPYAVSIAAFTVANNFGLSSDELDHYYLHYARLPVCETLICDECGALDLDLNISTGSFAQEMTQGRLEQIQQLFYRGSGLTREERESPAAIFWAHKGSDEAMLWLLSTADHLRLVGCPPAELLHALQTNDLHQITTSLLDKRFAQPAPRLSQVVPPPAESDHDLTDDFTL